MHINNVAFMSFITLIGFWLLYPSWDMNNKMRNKTCKGVLNTLNMLVATVAVTCIVFGLSFAICMSKCDCRGTGSIGGFTVGGFTLLLGIFLIVVGSMVIQNAKGECEDLKGSGTMVLVPGLFMVVGSLGYGFMKTQNTTSPVFSFWGGFNC